MDVTVNAMELIDLMAEKVCDATNRNAAEASKSCLDTVLRYFLRKYNEQTGIYVYMNCHDAIHQYLCRNHKEETGMDVNDVANMCIDTSQEERNMNVEVDAIGLINLISGKVSDAENREAVKAYMDCHDTVLQYFCRKYKEQTEIDANDVTNMFRGN